MNSEELFLEDNDWDYKDVLKIEPCPCNQSCGNHILYIRGIQSHLRNVPDDEFVDIATLHLSDLYDLVRNCFEILDLEEIKEDLEQQIKLSESNDNDVT